MTQSKKSTSDNSHDNHTIEDYYHVITTTTDLEEGIEIPLPLEEGVELPLAVFEGIDSNNTELFESQTKRVTPCTPTTITSTSTSDDEDDAFVDEFDSGKHTTTTTTWSSWKSYKVRVWAIILIVTSTLILVSYTTYHLVTSKISPNDDDTHDYSNTRDNYDNNFPLSECQGDCDSSGGNDDNNGGSSGSNIAAGEREKKKPSSTFSTEEQAPPPPPPPPPPPRDRFLLAGQSNMIGHTTSRGSITGDNLYWRELKSILDAASSSSAEGGGNIKAAEDGNGTSTAGVTLTTMEQKLYNIIYQANNQTNDSHNTIDQVATTLTQGVMELYQSSLLNDLDTPLQHGKCSFLEVDDDHVYNVSRGTVPIKWDANCGRSFGHELLFGRTMELERTMNYYYNSSSISNEFELVKVARGGSGLYEHWYPNHGLHWDLLKGVIEERRQEVGDWKGFIWHQGSQAAWSANEYGEDRSHTYHGNLTGLVNEVRELMFQNSMKWRCKEEIPVVIVQVGYWPSNTNSVPGAAAAAQRTRDAQAEFCNKDPRAVLVKTDDLARFYHYDVASFLISGNRIAHAYQEALEGVVECSETERVGSSSSSPFSALLMEPSKSLEQTVLRLETVVPTNELV